MNERQTALLEYVSEFQKVEVSVLAERLHTSKVTIRKDLDYLSERGILRRERGYAVLNAPDDINYRLAFHYERKQQIAQVAVQYVENGETLIIESGSTCALFAEELTKARQNLTIITNSMHIASFIKDSSNTQIILLGGVLQPQTQALVGPLTKDAIRAFHVDKIFVGTDGYSKSLGFTGNDLIRSDTLQEMINYANKTYVLTESEKFSKPGSVSFLTLDKVYEVITDSEIPYEESLFLKQQGLRLTLV
ncbi:DeoR/GlpR family DNA-binding transcription regulator [Lachnospiraceae bacterium LCP25S3_G4]